MALNSSMRGQRLSLSQVQFGCEDDIMPWAPKWQAKHEETGTVVGMSELVLSF
jgi:hypothetical protein